MPRADIEALDKRIAALEDAAKTTREALSRNTGNDNAARLALNAAVLRDAIVVGAPYADELAAVKLLGGDDKALWPRSRPSPRPVCPDKKALARELGALTPTMLKVSGAKSAERRLPGKTRSQCQPAGEGAPAERAAGR